MTARTYQRRIKRLIEIIDSMQWVQPTYNGSPSCAYCGEQKHLHTQNCEVSRLLRQDLREITADSTTDDD